MKLNKILPNSLIMLELENNVYAMGLSIKPYNDESKARKSIYNPYLILSILLIALLRSILLVMSDNRKLLDILGDRNNLFGMRVYFYSFAIFTLIMILSLQLIFLSHDMTDIKPTFVRVFEMMSGLVSPASVGLNHQIFVRQLVRRTKLLFWLTERYSNYLFPLFAALIVLIPHFNNYNTKTFLLYAIPNALLFTITSHYCINILL